MKKMKLAMQSKQSTRQTLMCFLSEFDQSIRLARETSDINFNQNKRAARRIIRVFIMTSILCLFATSVISLKIYLQNPLPKRIYQQTGDGQIIDITRLAFLSKHHNDKVKNTDH